MKKVTFAPLYVNEAFKILMSNPEAEASMLPHSSDKDAVFVLLSGSVKFLLGKETSELSSNDSILIPQNIRHSFLVLEESKCLLILDANAKIIFER